MSCATQEQAEHPERRWVTIDGDDVRWRFDEEFLRSSWSCIYGRGCRGCDVTQDATLAIGCCTVGTRFTDADDFVATAASIGRLTPDIWQHAGRATRTGWFKRLPGGAVGTRVVDGACILLNRPGFATGPGCALHLAAVQRGEDPMLAKPNVCWQFPLHCTTTYGDGIDRRATTTVRRWRRADWESMEDAEWWCTDAPEAFGASEPLYRTIERELRALCGDDVYDALAAELD